MKRKIKVVQVVEVEVDEDKFTDDFLSRFRQTQYDFDLSDHLNHIAQLEARGILQPEFVEGYGPAKDMGIRACASVVEIEPAD